MKSAEGTQYTLRRRIGKFPNIQLMDFSPEHKKLLQETVAEGANPVKITELASFQRNLLIKLKSHLESRDKPSKLETLQSLSLLVDVPFRSDNFLAAKALIHMFPNMKDEYEIKTQILGIPKEIPVFGLLAVSRVATANLSNNGNNFGWKGQFEFVGRSLEELKSQLRKNLAKTSFWASICLAGIALSTVGCYIYWKKTQRLRQILSLATEGKKLDSSDPNVENLRCLVCFENQRCICTQPCGHLVMCGTCYFEHLKSRQFCIVCR